MVRSPLPEDQNHTRVSSAGRKLETWQRRTFSQIKKINTADSGGVKSISFRGKGGEVGFTFGFRRGFLLVAAVRNVLDAEIAENLVEVRGVDEHVVYGEGLHGALAGFFPSAQVKSVIGAAFVEGGGGGGVDGGGGGWRCIKNKDKRLELWVKEERFWPGLRALPRRCALTCGRAAFLCARSDRLQCPPPLLHTPPRLTPY